MMSITKTLLTLVLALATTGVFGIMQAEHPMPTCFPCDVR